MKAEQDGDLGRAIDEGAAVLLGSLALELGEGAAMLPVGEAASLRPQLLGHPYPLPVKNNRRQSWQSYCHSNE